MITKFNQKNLIKDSILIEVYKYFKFLSILDGDKNYYGGVKEDMKISPIVWNGVIWSPEKKLGHFC